MKISSLLFLIICINLVACLGDEAPDNPEPTQTHIITNEQEVGSAIEDCEELLASYSNFQQIYNDCTSWDEDMGTLKVKYRSDNANLTGFGLRVHFDSTALSFDKLSYNFPNDYIGSGGPYNDVDDLDNHATTDKYITAAWASLLGNWPGENTTNQITNYAEIALVNIDFNRVDNSTENYVINFTPSSSAASVNLILGR